MSLGSCVNMMGLLLLWRMTSASGRSVVAGRLAGAGLASEKSQ